MYGAGAGIFFLLRCRRRVRLGFLVSRMTPAMEQSTKRMSISFIRKDGKGIYIFPLSREGKKRGGEGVHKSLMESLGRSARSIGNDHEVMAASIGGAERAGSAVGAEGSGCVGEMASVIVSDIWRRSTHGVVLPFCLHSSCVGAAFGILSS